MTAQPTVIIVDDDPGIPESLEGLLRSVGLQVKALASVPEFVKEGRPEGSACFVLDVRLPGRSGLDSQRELSAANIHAPIIFITGYGDIPMSVRAIKGGADRVPDQAVPRSRSAGRDPAGARAGSRVAGERKGDRGAAGALRDAHPS
jgi:ActR/RegA family two-component response regulator